MVKKKISERNKVIKIRKTPKRSKKGLIKIPESFSILSILIGLFAILFLFNFLGSNHTKVLKKSYVSNKKVVSKVVKPIGDKLYKLTPTPEPIVPSVNINNPNDFCVHVPVLMYHHIQPESQAKALGQTALTVDNVIFDTQMQYLVSAGYTPIFANELAQALISKTSFPGKPIVITMDDGYADNVTYALPVLQKYNLKANIMLATGLMGNNNMLSWDNVKTLKNSGLIYFTNHTWSHYAISNGPQSKVELEIDTASQQIQDEAGQVANVFTYPYGAFNANAVNTLQRKGYLGAFSEIPGQYQCQSFIMTLHRTRIGNSSLPSYGL